MSPRTGAFLIKRMWEDKHPYRWRTWIRAHLPWFLIDLGIARKGHDCEAVGGWHHWYHVDDSSSGCHHCEVVRPGRLWNDEDTTAEHSRDLDADDVLTLEGPVERLDGKLALLIPLDEGGDKFLECCRGISEVQGNSLKIAIPEWLSGVLRIEEGDVVSIDNANGKLNIRPVNARPIH
jgi:hypothetical protein